MTKVEKRNPKTLENLAAEINAEHHAFVGSLKKTAEHGIRAGELLSEAKSKCKHGQWLPWLEQNFDGAPRTAQTYMQLYNKRDELRAKTQSSAHLSIGGALKEIAAPASLGASDDEPEKEELTDPQVVELVHAFMEMEGPTELSDIEQAALERRLAKPGERERDLLSGIHFEHIMMYGCQVAQDGFIRWIGAARIRKSSTALRYRSQASRSCRSLSASGSSAARRSTACSRSRSGGCFLTGSQRCSSLR